MKTLKLILFAAILFVAIASGEMAVAQTPQQVQAGVDSIGGGNSPAFELTLRTIINTFLYLLGAIAVVMLIYGGFKYVTSAGDSSAVSSAKSTILYAVVGIVVALSAYAIADFVVDSFGSSSKPLTAAQCQDIPVELRYNEEECL